MRRGSRRRGRNCWRCRGRHSRYRRGSRLCRCRNGRRRRHHCRSLCRWGCRGSRRSRRDNRRSGARCFCRRFLGLGGCFDGRFGGGLRIGGAFQLLANFYRDVFRDRARVGLFFRDSVARQKIDDGLGLDFQLAGQLIYADLICVAQDFASSGCSVSPSADSDASSGAA